MAITQVTPDNAARYNAGQKGYNGLSLTNFDNTSAPQIASGSVIEIGGSLWEASIAESITGWGGIGIGVQAYIYMDALGSFAYSATVPTYDTSKQGWYNVNDRAVAGVLKGSAAAYVSKYIYTNTGQNVFGHNGIYYPVMENPVFIATDENQTYGIVSWDKGQLNTLKTNTISGASMTSSVVTLPPGKYKSAFWYYASQAGNNAVRLRDTTNSITLGVSGGMGTGAANSSNGEAYFTLTGITTMELQIFTGSVQGGILSLENIWTGYFRAEMIG